MYKIIIENELVSCEIPTVPESIEKAIGLYYCLGTNIHVMNSLTGEIIFSIGENKVYVSSDIKYTL